MARLAAIDPATATGPARPLLRRAAAPVGSVPNVLRTMANAPAALRGYLAFEAALSDGALRAGLREQIALAVASAHGCAYCLARHRRLGTLAGLDVGDIAPAMAGATASDPRAAAALRFARALVARRGAVTEDEFTAVRLAGYTDAEIVEIVVIVGLVTMTNYLALASQVVADDAPP